MIFSWKNGVLKLALKQINNIFWINKVLRSVSSQTWHHVGPVNRKEFLFSENQSDSTPGALAGGANLRSPVNGAPYGRFGPHCPTPFFLHVELMYPVPLSHHVISSHFQLWWNKLPWQINISQKRRTSTWNTKCSIFTKTKRTDVIFWDESNDGN